MGWIDKTEDGGVFSLGFVVFKSCFLVFLLCFPYVFFYVFFLGFLRFLDSFISASVFRSFVGSLLAL